MVNMIFDDVFRTMCQKMPELLLPVINEVFGTHYNGDEEITQLRNEHLEKFRKIITDTTILVAGRTYHLECQSTDDGAMALRMFEYDIAVSIEEARNRGEPYQIRMPKSCVIYLRNGNSRLRKKSVEIIFADDTKHTYDLTVLELQNYSLKEIFEKDLLMFLPFYILRYEQRIKETEEKERPLDEEILNNYSEIIDQLEKCLDDKAKRHYYEDLLRLIYCITEYIMQKSANRNEVAAMMGGQVLELQHEIWLREGREEGRKQGREEGREQGRENLILEMIQDGYITPEQGAKKLGISPDEMRARLSAKH